MKSKIARAAACLIFLTAACAAQDLTITGSFGAPYPNGSLFTSAESPASNPQIEAWVDPSNANFPKPILSFYLSGTDAGRGDVTVDSDNYTVQWSINATYEDKCNDTGFKVLPPNPCPSSGGFLNYINPGDSSLAGGANFNPDIVNSSYGGMVKVTAAVYYTPGQGGSGGCTGSNQVGTAEILFQVAGKTQSEAQTDSAVPSNAPWFARQILAYESSGRGCGATAGENFFGQQFFDNVHGCGNPGMPFWGSPDGIGVMQLDRTEQPSYFGGSGNSNPYASDQDPYWQYSVNIADGLQVLNGNQAMAVQVWYNAMENMCQQKTPVSKYTDGNTKCNDGTGVAVSTTSIDNPNPEEGWLDLSCEYEGEGAAPAVVATWVPFAYDPNGQPAGTLPITDANWITSYNGYLEAVLTPGGKAQPLSYVDYATGHGGWYTLYRTGSYAMKICRTAPY
ncbi:MAG: hypothetical protein ACRD1C_03080 [Terriglobales bacterium]